MNCKNCPSTNWFLAQKKRGETLFSSLLQKISLKEQAEALGNTEETAVEAELDFIEALSVLKGPKEAKRKLLSLFKDFLSLYVTDNKALAVLEKDNISFRLYYHYIIDPESVLKNPFTKRCLEEYHPELFKEGDNQKPCLARVK